ERSDFPFTVPSINSLESLTFAPGVTFFVGEHGSGKSTLLEGIAAAAALPTVGAADTGDDEMLAAQRRLARALRLTWSKRTRKGFFLRAEDFFGFQKRVLQQQRELQDRLREIESTFAGAPEKARGLARMPVNA